MAFMEKATFKMVMLDDDGTETVIEHSISKEDGLDLTELSIGFKDFLHHCTFDYVGEVVVLHEVDADEDEDLDDNEDIEAAGC